MKTFLGNAFFDVFQLPYFMEVYVVDEVSELKECHGEKDWDESIHAFCMFDYDAPEANIDKVGELIFLEERFDFRTIVHECTHAALCLSNFLMHQEEVVKMTNEEQHEYFNELVPTMTDSLFSQVEKMKL